MSYRIGFVFEETLGHKTILENLKARAAADPDVAGTWMPIPFEAPGGRIPILGRNYSIRASILGRRLAAAAARTQRIDAFLYHTQVTALFSNSLMRSIPTVISLDATPINYDSVGAGYGHVARPNDPAEKFKFLLNRRAFRVARRLLTSSEWAKASLVDDYGIAPEKVAVIDPGVDLAVWAGVGAGRVPRDAKPKILFVGGDFRRKGGPLLLDVFRRHFRDAAELHLVTAESVPPEPGVFSYNNLGANADGLRRLYHEADLFALPTVADVSSLASREAMAAHLPVVVSATGAIPELIEEGSSGFLIPVDDGEALRDRIATLIADPARRLAMGERGHAIARQRFDSRKNMQGILDLLKGIARSSPDGAQTGGEGPP